MTRDSVRRTSDLVQVRFSEVGSSSQGLSIRLVTD